MLCCDLWPFSGGHSIIRVCSGENKQERLAFHKMLENFLSKAEYISWSSRKIATSFNPTQAKSTSFADKVKLDGNLALDEKNEKQSAIRVDYQSVTNDEGESSQVFCVLKTTKESQWVIKIFGDKFEKVLKFQGLC